MPLERSPPKTHHDFNTHAAPEELNVQAATAALANLAVLRSRRTRAKNYLLTNIEELQTVESLTNANRLQFRKVKAHIEGRVKVIREIIDQIARHPDLPQSEVERESEEAEDAIEAILSGQAIVAALLAEEAFEKGDSKSVPIRESSPLTAAEGQRNPANGVVDSQPSAFESAGSQDTTTDDGSEPASAIPRNIATAPTPSSIGVVNNVVSNIVTAPSPSTDNDSVSNNCANSKLYLDTIPDAFDGSISRYKLWKAQFLNYVRRRTKATNSDKLVALCKLLTGPPRALISELPLTDGNFDVALKLLDDNYDVPELRQRDVLANIVHVPSVRHSNDAVGLRELLNVTQRTILSLSAVNVPLRSIALPYEQTIRKALPIALLLNFEEHHQQTRTSVSESEEVDQAAAAETRLEQLLAYLRKYTAIRERVSASASKQLRNTVGDFGNHETTDQRPNKSRDTSRRPPRRQTTSTAAATTKGGNRGQTQDRRNPCLFCKGFDHQPSTCSADIPLQRRREMLTQRRRCFKCFQFEHTPPRSCSGPKEPCRICKSNSHYTAMHEPVSPVPAAQHRTSAGVTQTVAAVTAARAVVMTAAAFIAHGNRRFRVRCFIDSGSMISFATTKLIRQLTGLKPQARVDLHLQGFASEHSVTANQYAIRLMSTHDDSERVVIRAHEYDFGVDPPTNCSEKMRQLIRQFGQSHPLADVSIVDPRLDMEPDLLIGIDQMYKIMHLNGEQLIADGLVAKSTRFGWIVSGSFGPNTTRGDISRVHPICCAAMLSLPAKDVQRLWTLDAIGICDSEKTDYSAAEEDAIRQFRESVSYDGQRYTVSMPKRASIDRLPNNMEVARNRLAAKRRSLARDPDSFRRYDSEIMAFFRAGYAEEISDIDLSLASVCDGSFYMPHRQVITPRENGDKWRIVFDCSASAPGATSLNSHLLAGPNLNPNILKLLMNFRLRSVALSADVAQAYMTISLAASDRPYFRYLWQGPDDDRLRCFQMQRVTWGATPSGFLLAAVLREHFRLVDPASTYDLGGSFYFDDMLISFDSDAQATRFIERLVAWTQTAGMTLRKWKSNSAAVVDYVHRLSPSSESSGLVETGLLKVLGIAWAPADDSFRFRLPETIRPATNSKIVTKRSVLRVVASLYDPVGWLIPFTLRGKLIIQRLWSSSLRWDDPVPSPLLQDFNSWAAEVLELTSLRIPRLYGNPQKSTVGHQLHVFGDASERAYAAAAYLQTSYSDGSSSCALLMSKSRVAPREKVTLPRLELMAALLAARLRGFIVERLAVKVDRVCHYTDSAVAFHWCTAGEPTRWKTFVCNRVIEIQRLSSSEEWFHVAGKQNIADIASRGTSVADLCSNSEWWYGPSWLSDPEDRRPVGRLRPGSDKLSSLGKELRLVVAPAAATSVLVDLERVGGWEKAVRVVANVLRFAQRSRRQPPSSDSALRTRSELLIIKSSQQNHFSAEIMATLSREAPVRSSKLASYRLHLDDNGLLRARTRLTLGPQFTYDEANPVIIPSPSRLATLLVLHYHRVNAHLGVSAVLNAIRRRFCILRGRQLIKKILRGCVICKRVHGPAADQVQAPLPAERTTLTAPFAVAAVDFCGPFYTRSRKGTFKNYIALFSCASVRAIHLELVEDMTTLQTHLAIRRFLAEYPACRLFISDNGRSFVRADADIRRLFNSFHNPNVRELLAKHRIDWMFNCPRAPWRGGFFERLIGVVKSSLKKVLGLRLIGEEELRTILRELAAVINNRPLSYTYAELDEPRALTPAHFIRGGPPSTPLCALSPLDVLGPNGTVRAEPPEAATLRKELLERTNYFRSLSQRWRKDYLLQLRSANLDARGRSRPIPADSVCLLEDGNVPRTKWNPVRVLQAHPGRDGAVRTYSVRFANGHESRRPAQSLIPLEVPDQPTEPKSA